MSSSSCPVTSDRGCCSSRLRLLRHSLTPAGFTCSHKPGSVGSYWEQLQLTERERHTGHMIVVVYTLLQRTTHSHTHTAISSSISLISSSHFHSSSASRGWRTQPMRDIYSVCVCVCVIPCSGTCWMSIWLTDLNNFAPVQTN